MGRLNMISTVVWLRTATVVIPLIGIAWCISALALRRTRRELQNKASALASALSETANLSELSLQQQQRVAELEYRYVSPIDVDSETERRRAEIKIVSEQVEQIRNDYTAKKVIYDRLITEVAIFDDRISFAELGVYQPHFDYDDSEQFKAAILAVREEQKAMIAYEQAVIRTTNWTLDGSASKGATMTKRNIRLTSRAFNNECEAAIANARWNNVNAMERRILNARQQIDKMNASNSTFICEPYLQLKLKELRLTHEYREMLKAEREERSELVRAQREELKLQRDIEKAEEDELRYSKLLDRARAEAEKAVGAKLGATASKYWIWNETLPKPALSWRGHRLRPRKHDRDMSI